MPAPLPLDHRERVMAALSRGHSVTEAAHWLGVSRRTIHRWQQAAAEQGIAVPRPRPMGGYRGSRLQRVDIQTLAQQAQARPKATLEEIRAEIPVRVSRSTVARALHKVGLRQRPERHLDPLTQRNPLLAAERRAFRAAQHTLPLFDPHHLLFFDETLFYLNEQASRAWGLQGAHTPAPVLYQRKGKTLSTALFLTLGVGAEEGSFLLHYQLHPPARPFPPVSRLMEASELPNPGAPVAIDSVALDSQASRAMLQAVLRRHGVQSTGSRVELRARVEHLATRGPLGLPRPGRRDTGGPLQPLRSTVRDVALYLEQHLVPHLSAAERAQRTLVWDNAATHSAVAVESSDRISVFHRLFRQWGFRGCIFLPPRSPGFQPVEAAFAFLKHWVRKWAPDDGYTQAGLEDAIRRALARITPSMVRNWVHGCGYTYGRGSGALDTGPSRAVADTNRNPLSPRWADLQGTLHAVGAREDLLDIRVRSLRMRQETQPELNEDSAPRRWPGFPGEPPVGATETQPLTYLRSLVDHEEIFEPERIVGERRWHGVTEYRIRWRGYAEEDDT
jgi:transposase